MSTLINGLLKLLCLHHLHQAIEDAVASENDSSVVEKLIANEKAAQTKSITEKARRNAYSLFQTVWVGGILGALFTALGVNAIQDLSTLALFTPLDWELTFINTLRYAYLLWFMVYFATALIINHHDMVNYQVSKGDVIWDVAASLAAFIILYLLNFIVPYGFPLVGLFVMNVGLWMLGAFSYLLLTVCREDSRYGSGDLRRYLCVLGFIGSLLTGSLFYVSSLWLYLPIALSVVALTVLTYVFVRLRTYQHLIDAKHSLHSKEGDANGPPASQ